ncbi:MAG: M28 family peptidase [Bacteroidetes bacterium]|nr:MAG: M28 family peptidase [Bacteroidota bacterium]
MKKIVLLLAIAFLFSHQLICANDPELQQKMRQHVSILASDSLQGRGLGTRGAEIARDYIVAMFEEVGVKPFEQMNGEFLQHFRFRQNLAWIDGWNIVGYIEGSDPLLRNEYIVLGAHWDHLGYKKQDGQKTIYPGADDNASGVAAIIELARYFSEHPQLLQRSLIIVAFDAEESGLIGSKHFVSNSPVPLNSIKLMFSLDMVGMYEANKGLHLKGMASMKNGVELAESVAPNHTLRLRDTGSKIERRTDTAPFGDSGIPSVHVFTGSKSPYHKPEDQYHLLDYEGMVKIHNYMSELVSRLSAQPDILPSPSLIAHATAMATGTGNRISSGVLLNAGSGFHRYDDEFYRANSVFAGSVGLYLQIPLSRFFTLQQELHYDFNGSRMEGGVFRRHSVVMPLNIQLGTPRTVSIPVRFYSFAGPYFRYNFAGSAAGSTLDFEIYSEQEWGYSLGFALELFGFTMGYTQRRALTGLFEDSQVNVFDSNGYFSLGYRF